MAFSGPVKKGKKIRKKPTSELPIQKQNDSVFVGTNVTR